MENCVEKIYCCDRDNNDNALAAAILANGGYRRNSDNPLFGYEPRQKVLFMRW